MSSLHGISRADVPGAFEEAPVRSFREYCFDASSVKDLLVGGGRQQSVGVQLLQMASLLGTDPLRKFPSLAQLLGHPPELELLALLRTHFLGLSDALLQRLAMLKAVYPGACALVATLEWEWLADWLDLGRLGEDASTCLRSLSNLAHPIARVNLRFTYHCNFRCAHCYNSSAPERKAERLALADLLNIIEQMPALGIFELNLTGGEPLLYPEEVAAMISKARALGIKRISIMTNAWWAQTPDQVQAMLDRLSTAGFMTQPGDYIKASAGVHHQPYLAFERILSLAKSFHTRFGRPLLVDYEVHDSGEMANVRTLVAAREVENAIKLRFRQVSAIGRGADLTTQRSSDVGWAPCHAIDEIVYDPDGSIRPCCGLNADNLGVRIAEHSRHDLAAAIRRLQNDPITQFLATRPLRDLAPYRHCIAGDEHDSLCHLCQQVLGDLSDRESLMSALFPQQRFYPFAFSPQLSR
jgi:organic radical activating enzyme